MHSPAFSSFVFSDIICLFSRFPSLSSARVFLSFFPLLPTSILFLHPFTSFFLSFLLSLSRPHCAASESSAFDAKKTLEKLGGRCSESQSAIIEIDDDDTKKPEKSEFFFCFFLTMGKKGKGSKENKTKKKRIQSSSIFSRIHFLSCDVFAFPESLLDIT